LEIKPKFSQLFEPNNVLLEPRTRISSKVVISSRALEVGVALNGVTCGPIDRGKRFAGNSLTMIASFLLTAAQANTQTFDIPFPARVKSWPKIEL
jgi:hypothetical protein